MKAIVDRYAWIDKAQLSPSALRSLKRALTVIPNVYNDEEAEPIPLYEEYHNKIGCAREYVLANQAYDCSIALPLSDKLDWPSDLVFDKNLRSEQAEALQSVHARLCSKSLGGVLQAKPGWGKTVWACALMARMNVPTLIVVHKEFLMTQWISRIKQFLPGAKIGIIQQDKCEFKGKNIVLGMVHSLASRDYNEELYRWPDLVITDECHRIGARTWASVPAKFYARYRLGLTATPRRRDGAENVFRYHLGGLLFRASEQRLKFSVRRVRTPIKTKSEKVPISILTNIIVKNLYRNRIIVDQLRLALDAGRKVLVLSHRRKHLEVLHAMLRAVVNKLPSVGYYVGGSKEAALEQAANCRVVLATYQLVTEGLDIPALDTLILTTPAADVEQAVGRILRPCEGKKAPIVVDFRDDKIGVLRRMGAKRDMYYATGG